MAAPDQVYRAVSRLFAVIILGFGVTILVVTLVNGGGPLSLGFLLGLVFTGPRRRPPILATRTRVVSEQGDGEAPDRRLPMRTLARRSLGVPWLFAVSYSAVGFSIYFSIGLVAERGLALTPLIFLGVGIVFMLNAMTYIEGAAMFRERGGSSTLGAPRLQRAGRRSSPAGRS